jgi:hypothetical protein
MLLINHPTTTSSGKSTRTSAPAGGEGAKTTTIDGKVSITITSQVAFPTGLPSRIIPASSSDTDTSRTVSAGEEVVATTVISILLGESLPWTWVVSNSDASGQIMYYMPILLAQALDITTDDIQTVALQAYQSASYDPTKEDVILTVYLASIPSIYVDSLEAMLKAANSPLYTQDGISGQLAVQFVSSFSVTAYAATELAASNSGSTSSDGTAVTTVSKSDNSKTIIIATVVSCGIVLLAIAAYLALRATKRGAIALGSASPRMDRARERDMDPTLRTFQLGGGRTQVRDSFSSTSTASTGFSGSSRDDGAAGAGRHGASTSVDMSDRRSSFWRFSGGSGGAGAPASSPSSGGGVAGDMREGPRRINIVRGPNGQFDSSVIGR